MAAPRLLKLRSTSLRIRRGPLCSFVFARPVAPVADFNEKTFVTHAGEVTPGNSNVSQIFRSDLPPLSREGDRAFPQRGFRAAGQPNSLSAVAITLPHPNGRPWRSGFEGNRQLIVRIFIRPGEPIK